MTMRIALVMCTGALLQLSTAQWVALTPATTPPARTVACFAQIKGGTLMFSGAEGGHVASADTWLWRDNNWHDVSALGGGKAPPARSLGAMAAYKEGVVLFGGYTTTDHSVCVVHMRVCACGPLPQAHGPRARSQSERV